MLSALLKPRIQVGLRVDVREGATAVLATQASTKVPKRWLAVSGFCA
jgi:hypothetical protein